MESNKLAWILTNHYELLEHLVIMDFHEFQQVMTNDHIYVQKRIMDKDDSSFIFENCIIENKNRFTCVMTDRHGYDQNQITIGYDEMIKGAYKHPTIYKICIFLIG